MSNHHQALDDISSSVDCTLSLGTPYTRQSDQKSINYHHHHQQRSHSNSMSNFRWNIFQTNKQSSSSKSTNKSNREVSNIGNSLSGGDPLLTRRCTNCDTTSTPLWRNGPRGPKSLCNACGIRYKKEERRANSATTFIEPQVDLMSQQHHQYYSWGSASSSSMSPGASIEQNEFRFIEEEEEEEDREIVDTSIPFLSWGLDVSNRNNLLHDYT